MVYSQQAWHHAVVKHRLPITDLQHPPIWRESERIRERPRTAEDRKARDKAVGSNPLYEYCQGMNFSLLSGKVVREPRAAGVDGSEYVWFRMCVPNQDNPRQRLFLSVRSHGALAIHVWENVTIGDEVVVVGRIWSAKRGKSQFVFMAAERVSSSYPVQLDVDPRFVRVRIDFWNRVSGVLEGMPAGKIPEPQKKKLLAELHRILSRGDTIEQPDDVDEDRLDPDPSSNQDLP